MAATEPPTHLEVRDATVRFGGITALDRVSLDVGPGEVVGVIGPNGAGKTTFFNLISGFVPVTSGTIAFDGKDITALPVVKRVARGIVRTFQITEILPDLTVFENVRIGFETAAGVNARPWLRPAQRRAIERRVFELLEIMDLATKADHIVGALAHGDQRVVEMAMALSLEPRLVLLDEPTAGMGDAETEHMVELVRRLHREQRTAILFIEHDMDIVFGLAEHITVLDQGRTLAAGTPEAIAADERVRAAYLGEAQ